VESHLQSISEPAKRMVSMTTNTLRVAEAPIYAKLQRQIHYALRAQHPEWVQPDGNSPICDAYESRLAELLRILPELPVTKESAAGSVLRTSSLRSSTERLASSASCPKLPRQSLNFSENEVLQTREIEV
jgi:hypothetical protein